MPPQAQRHRATDGTVQYGSIASLPSWRMADGLVSSFLKLSHPMVPVHRPQFEREYNKLWLPEQSGIDGDSLGVDGMFLASLNLDFALGL